VDYQTRVAIVGGGIYGCGLLMQLVEKGWQDVTLIEKNELTAGSTWHAAGFCTHYSFNPTHVFMRKFSTDLYQQLERDGVAVTGYHRCRGLRITHDPDRIDEFHHGVSVGRQFNIDFAVLTPSEIREIYPMMDVTGLRGGLFEPTDGYVDPAQTTQAMARIARQGGATILRNNPVLEIDRLATGEWRLRTRDHQVLAEHIVLAPGFWANDVGKLIGLDLPITPMLHQYLVTEDHPDVAACEPESIPLVRHHDFQWYSRRERDGMLLGAYEQTPQTWSVDGVPASFGMELLPPDLDRVAHLMEDAMERTPALAEAGIKTVVHGPISYCADGQPLIGPAPGLHNAWLACGSGFGIGEGAGAGKLLAEWIVEGQPPMHMGAFDPRRFGPYAVDDYRIATAVEIFAKQFATHYPFEERDAGRGSRTSGLYQPLVEAGAQFGNVNGWERANWFANGEQRDQLSFRRVEWFNAVARECGAVNRRAGVIDLSGFSKFEVIGADAATFLESLSANRLPFGTGEVRVCHMLNEAATIECEFTITRLDDDAYYLVCAAAAERHHEDWLLRHLNNHDVRIENTTQKTAVLGIAGPAAASQLSRLTDIDLSVDAFPWLTARSARIAGAQCLLKRMSYTGEAGFEIHLPAAALVQVYEGLKALDHPPQDFGFYAMNSMRMEKAYAAWGAEITVENNPWELGLDRFIDTANRAFIGRDQLVALRNDGATQRLYQLEIDVTDSDPFGGEAVFQGAERAGVLVSAAFGHRTGKCLGFVLFQPGWRDNGEPLAVEVLDARCSARLLTEPAFDPGSLKPRSR